MHVLQTYNIPSSRDRVLIKTRSVLDFRHKSVSYDVGLPRVLRIHLPENQLFTSARGDPVARILFGMPVATTRVGTRGENRQ